MQGLRGGFDAEETCAAPAGSVPTMEVVQSSGASGEIIHQMDASLLEVSPQGVVHHFFGSVSSGPCLYFTLLCELRLRL